MFNRFRKASAAALGLAVALCFTVAAAEGDIDSIRERGMLRVGVKMDTPGIIFIDNQGNYSGLEAELAQRLAQSILGDADALSFVGVTAKTRGPMLDLGEVDVMLATFTIMPERLEHYAFSQPYFADAVGLMVKSGSGIASFDDLAGKTIGAPQSSNTRAVLESAAEQRGMDLDIVEFPTFDDIKEALDNGIVDCFSVDTIVLAGYMDDTAIILPEQFASQPYGAAVKLGSNALLAKIDETIASLRTTGELDGIIAKNNLTAVDWVELDGMAQAIWAAK